MSKTFRLGYTAHGERVSTEIALTYPKPGGYFAERGDGLTLSIVYEVHGRNGSYLSGGATTAWYSSIVDFVPPWDPQSVGHLSLIADRWHLNGMQAGCEHQRALGWHERRMDETQPAERVGKWYPGHHGSANLAGWVYPREHPRGVLAKPCHACGYRFGTEWLYEPLPRRILDWAARLGIEPEAALS